jgi:hypothetical protein
MEVKKKRSGLLGKIEDRADALKTIKESSYVFIFIAILQGAISFFVVPKMFIDAALFLICALLLMWLKSRTVAIILLVISLAAAVVSVLIKIGGTTVSGSYIIFTIIILIASAKATEATFKLHGKFKENGKIDDPAIPQTPT